MKKSGILVFCLAMSCFSQAHAAFEVELSVERTVDGVKNGYQIRSQHQGNHSKTTFIGSDIAEASGEFYLLSFDGGNTMHVVDSKDNSCQQWSNEKLGQTLSEFMLKTGDRFNIDITKPQITKAFEKAAEPILGFPAKHIRLKLSYDASYNYMLFKDRYHVVRSADIWLTPDISDQEVVPVFQTLWQYTGSDDPNQKISAMAGEDKHHRLRSRILQTMTNKKDEQSAIQIDQSVTSIREVDDYAEEQFSLPDCKELSSKEMEKRFKAFIKKILGA